MYSAFTEYGFSKKPSSHKSSHVVGGRDERWEASNPPPGCSPSKSGGIELSPVLCSWLRSTTGVHLAPCHDEFPVPRFDYVR
ncbi:hypothetical protein TNCV_3034071 [Trichonephila clavipes]|nr:hypothetical protein TNCV_3034071 [Trichonephila clavipes]